MAEQADEAGRLEAALERIAQAAAHHHDQRPAAVPEGQTATVAIDIPALAARLDALIAELRTILGQS